MSTLDINHIKVEKANAIKLRCQKLRKLASFLRAFEVLLLLAVISRVSLHVPLVLGPALRLCYEYLRYLSLFLVSPQFVFILGNVIVVTLFLNSGHFNGLAEVKLPKHPPCEHNSPPNTTDTMFATPYETKLPKSPPEEQKVTTPLPKKQGVKEETLVMAAVYTAPPPENHQRNHRQLVKVYNRSKSEKPIRVKTEKGCSRLRRSNTELIKVKDRKAGEGYYLEDHMSNEEFRKTIEDFIAKQQRLLREEEEFSYLESDFDL